MKKRFATAALLVALLVPAVAAGGVRPPGVTRGIAEREVRSLLQKEPTWRYRANGYIDCRFGKINRTRWACRVGWWRGNYCRFGRVQVYGFVREGEQWYGTRGKLARCVAP